MDDAINRYINLLEKHEQLFHYLIILITPGKKSANILIFKNILKYLKYLETFIECASRTNYPKAQIVGT